MTWGTGGHCHKGCPVVLLQHLKNDLQLLLCGGAELQEGGALLLWEQGGPVSRPQLLEPVPPQLPLWLPTGPGSFPFCGTTDLVWIMFGHITEFFQVHLTLKLTLLCEDSCRDPEGLGSLRVIGGTQPVLLSIWRGATLRQHSLFGFLYEGETTYWSDLLGFEGLSVAACGITTMNSPHVLPAFDAL